MLVGFLRIVTSNSPDKVLPSRISSIVIKSPHWQSWWLAIAGRHLGWVYFGTRRTRHIKSWFCYKTSFILYIISSCTFAQGCHTRIISMQRSFLLMCDGGLSLVINDANRCCSWSKRTPAKKKENTWFDPSSMYRIRRALLLTCHSKLRLAELICYCGWPSCHFIDNELPNTSSQGVMSSSFFEVLRQHHAH